jgi:anti-sigma28 factor (negative regulator of flagellin synthesis)
MSSVNNVGGSSPIQKIITPPVQKQVAPGAPTTTRPSDRVELSGLSHLLKTLKTNDVRADKVADIRAQIQAGTYETDKKLDVATDRLLDDLTKD